MAVGAVTAYHLTPAALLNAVLLGVIYAIVDVFCGAVWVCAGQLLQKVLANQKKLMWMNRSLAVLLVASIALEWIIQ